MGIAIIWIVLFHSNISAPDNFFLRVLWYLFVSFGGGIGVDIFFILSGFGLFYSVQAADNKLSKSDWGKWIVKRMKRILPSYFIVAILYYILKGDFCLYNLCQLNFLVNGIRDFWFIPAIVICYLLFPLFYQIGKKIGFRNMMIVSTLIVVAVTYALNYFNPIYYSKIEIFLQRIPCFVLGIYWGYLSVIKRVLFRNHLFCSIDSCLYVYSFCREFSVDFFLHDNSLYSSVTIVINLFRKYIEDYSTIFGKEEFTDIFDSCLLGNNVVKSDFNQGIFVSHLFRICISDGRVALSYK